MRNLTLVQLAIVATLAFLLTCKQPSAVAHGYAHAVAHVLGSVAPTFDAGSGNY